MPNKWITFVKEWSAENNMSYGCALSNSTMKAAYYKKHPNKKSNKAKEFQDTMGMMLEDTSAPEEKKYGPTKFEIKKARQRLKQFNEKMSMGDEDKDAPEQPKKKLALREIKTRRKKNETIVYQKTNPKKVGSAAYDRYEKYKNADTIVKARSLGATSADMDYDRKKGFFKSR